MKTNNILTDFNKYLDNLSDSKLDTLLANVDAMGITGPIKVHNRTVQERNEEIEAIELSEPETLDAIQEGKKKKWYRERNAEYWANREAERKGKATW